MNPPDELLLAATSVIDDAAPGWDDVQRSARGTVDDGVMRELRVIAGIAEFHRSLHRLANRPAAGDEWIGLELRELLGSGSYGHVYRAWDPALERDVALKVYRYQTADGVDRHALLAEGRLLAKVRHPNVVQVYGVEQRGEDVALRLELVDGSTLYDEVEARGPLGFREAAVVAQDLCRAAAAVHAQGLVHRDIKPQNVMRERGGRTVLMDFGIGRDLGQGPSATAPAGSPLYMAPELFAGGPPSIASDIYAIGVTLYFLVTGGFPIDASSRAEVEAAHRTGSRRLLRDARPDLPDAFVQVVERAIAADPAARFTSAGAMERALASVLGAGTSEGTPGGGRRVSRTAPLVIAASIVAAVAGGGWLLTRDVPNAPVTVPATQQGSGGTGDARQGVPTAGSYTIGAGFQVAEQAGDRPLAAGDRVRPGDRLFLTLQSSSPVHVYVVTHDDRGEAYLLFPLPGQALSNPLPAGGANRLPGVVAGTEQFWQVTSAGGREHFVVIASPEPLTALDQILAALPRPVAGRPIATAAPLSPNAVGQLRGVGGLTSRPGAATGSGGLFEEAAALRKEPEIVKGPWIRRIVFQNPG